MYTIQRLNDETGIWANLKSFPTDESAMNGPETPNDQVRIETVKIAKEL